MSIPLMNRLSKKFFKQIMLPIQIKQELDQFKEIVRIDMNVNHPISYADVIKFLIKRYKETIKIVYPLSQKLLLGKNLENKNLNVSIPLEKKSINTSSKLDGKMRVSYNVEN